LGKWLSNFAVLGVMVVFLMVVGIFMNLLIGTEGFTLWELVAPLLFIALPFMAIVAALAVLFETITWLRGGFGNIIYFFVFLFYLATSVEGLTASMVDKSKNILLDLAGWRLIGGSVSRAAKIAYPESSGMFSFSMSNLGNPKIFLWNGIDWSIEEILQRFFILLIAFGIGLLAALFFDRFNPSRVLRMKRKRTKSSEIESVTPPKTIPYTSLHLTPLTDLHSKFRFDALFIAELKLFLKGQPWWWYVIGLGLIVAQLLNELEVTRILLVISWVWPIMILGGLGCRESRYDTRQIVFSAPHPVMNQLPAAWLSAFTVIALMGSGALVRFILAGETISILGWMTGVLFIPSLALVSGILTGSSKAFEVVYVLWMYMITQNVPVFDFIGMTPESPLYIYAPLAIILVILAAFARQRQVITRSVTR